MEAATAHGIAGIIGPFEDQVQDVVEADRQTTSRLTCQIRMTADFDGIRLVVPKV